MQPSKAIVALSNVLAAGLAKGPLAFADTAPGVVRNRTLLCAFTTSLVHAMARWGAFEATEVVANNRRNG
jgi:hypothetical protein